MVVRWRKRRWRTDEGREAEVVPIISGLTGAGMDLRQLPGWDRSSWRRLKGLKATPRPVSAALKAAQIPGARAKYNSVPCSVQYRSPKAPLRKAGFKIVSGAFEKHVSAWKDGIRWFDGLAGQSEVAASLFYPTGSM
jgi:hypothetical protein